MAKCWTCGAEVDGFLHTCPGCAGLKKLTDIDHNIADVEQGIDIQNAIGALQLNALRNIGQMIAGGFDRIESGFFRQLHAKALLGPYD